MPSNAARKPQQLIPDIMATFAQSPTAFNLWATVLVSLSKALDVETRDSIGFADDGAAEDMAYDRSTMRNGT